MNRLDVVYYPKMSLFIISEQFGDRFGDNHTLTVEFVKDYINNPDEVDVQLIPFFDQSFARALLDLKKTRKTKPGILEFTYDPDTDHITFKCNDGLQSRMGTDIVQLMDRSNKLPPEQHRPPHMTLDHVKILLNFIERGIDNEAE